MASSSVHRELSITKPLTHGEDVTRLQGAVNDRLNARGEVRFVVKVDGIYGPATERACARAAFLLGAANSNVRTAQHGHLIKGLQRIVRYPWKRTPAQLARAAARRVHKGPHGPAQGVDVSNNNGTVDMKMIRAAGYDFVWCKLTESTNFVDGFAATDVHNARSAGLVPGGYHFLRPGNIAVQASRFVERVNQLGLKKGDLLPVVDAEAPGVTPAMVDQFLSDVQRDLGVRPIIYTFPAFAVWPSTFGAKLWIANFGVSRPTIPRPWKKYTAWQFSSTTHVPGVSGNCDVDTTPDIKELIR